MGLSRERKLPAELRRASGAVDSVPNQDPGLFDRLKAKRTPVKDKRMEIRIDGELKDNLCLAAEYKDMTVSQYVWEIIEQEINGHFDFCACPECGEVAAIPRTGEAICRDCENAARNSL